MVWPDPVSLGLFLLVVAAVAAMMIGAVAASAEPAARRATALRAAGLLGVWMALTGAFGASGIARVAEPAPVLLPLLVTNLVLAIGVGLSPVGARVATLPLRALVGFHLFRLPLEVVLHAWADQGTVPVAMSWSGENFDVVTPLLALVVVAFGARPRALVWLFELVGVGMLLNIFRIVMRNTPGSPLYVDPVGPPLLLGATFPMVWIVTVAVFGAIAGHVVLLRRLLARR